MGSHVDFWAKQLEHSRIKSLIVSSYFQPWATIISKWSDTPVYVDLFSGRGLYKDGSRSTPMLILDKISEKPSLGRVKLHFYEGTRDTYEFLRTCISDHPATKHLTQLPDVKFENIGQSILGKLPLNNSSFTFIDPCGYKGLTLELVTSVIESWGSDCIFYFSVHGVKRNLEREDQRPALVSIFGEDGYERLRNLATPAPFHLAACDELEKALRRRQSGYFLKFALEADEKQLITHYLVFYSKHYRGFAIMKDILAEHSVLDSLGNPTYLWSGVGQHVLDLDSRKETLEKRILRDFAGLRNTKKIVIDGCHKNHYLELDKTISTALDELIRQERIQVSPDTRPGRKGSFGPSTELTFPKS